MEEWQSVREIEFLFTMFALGMKHDVSRTVICKIWHTEIFIIFFKVVVKHVLESSWHSIEAR